MKVTQPNNGFRATPVHKRHDAVGGAFSHLHKEREADQDCQGHIPRLGVVHVAEAE